MESGVSVMKSIFSVIMSLYHKFAPVDKVEESKDLTFRIFKNEIFFKSLQDFNFSMSVIFGTVFGCFCYSQR